MAPDSEANMLRRRTLRQKPGYVVGGFVFLVLLPYGLSRASVHLDHLVAVSWCPSQPCDSSSREFR
jgi:hypothetical protein